MVSAAGELPGLCEAMDIVPVPGGSFVGFCFVLVKLAITISCSCSVDV